MKRKVIKQGHDTLTLTLPKRWAETAGIKPGDEVDVEEKGSNLIITNKNVVPKEESVSIDISKLDRSSALISIQGAYRYGYDSIRITSDKPTTTHYRHQKEVSISEIIHNVVGRCIGAEIVSSKGNTFHIKKLSNESHEEFDNVMRRVFRLLNEEIEEFIIAVENNDKNKLASIEHHHFNIKKFINYAHRLLNKFGHNEPKKTAIMFSVIEYLGRIENFVKNASRDMQKYEFKLSKRSIKAIKETYEIVKGYYEFFYNFNIEKSSPLFQRRDKIRYELFKDLNELTKEELLIIGGILQINEVILDLIELRMAL